MGEDRELTPAMREILWHSLGLNQHHKAFRNRYASAPGCDGHIDIMLLVQMGFMKQGRHLGSGLYCFHVTEAGRKAINAPPALYPEDICA